MAQKDELGRWGEGIAAEFLEDGGYSVIQRNWRSPLGEIDIVAIKDGCTAFVEVKTRSSTRYGHPFEAISTHKLARLRRLAQSWCRQQDPHPDRIRIDAIAVVGTPGNVPKVEHLMGVF